MALAGAGYSIVAKPSLATDAHQPPAAAVSSAGGASAPAVEPAADLHVPTLIDLMALPGTPDAGQDLQTPAPLSVEEVVSRALPAVVQITTPDGLGTGFFVSTGRLLTNAHVVGSHRGVNLRASDGGRRTASVQHVWREADIAVLEVDVARPDQGILPLAGPEHVRVGAEVVAIGSPFGLQNTVTRGIISGKRAYVYDRIGRQSVNVVQTDAAINPGNSGGPLIDRYGRVVGVNTLKIGAAQGLGFAVDMSYARRLLGEDFALQSEDDRRRERGARQYEEAVRILALRADERDAKWQQVRRTCFTREPGAAPRPREWFELWRGEPGLLRDVPSCQNWNPFFVEWARRVHDALQHYEQMALGEGVPAEQLRSIRRRYSMAWSAWER